MPTQNYLFSFLWIQYKIIFNVGLRNSKCLLVVQNDHFITLPEKSKDGKILSECQVQGEDRKICGIEISSGDSPTNLKAHLKKHHPEIAKIVKEADSKSTKEKPKEKVSFQQPTLTGTFFKKKLYAKDSDESKKIDKALALYFGGTNVPKSTVENKLFRNLMATLDGRYIVPGRNKITKMINKMSQDFEKKIRQLLSDTNTKRVNVTTDLWTKCDQTPFMGITAHF